MQDISWRTASWRAVLFRLALPFLTASAGVAMATILVFMTVTAGG